MSPRLLIVGDPGPVHVGAHLSRAARHLGLPAVFCDVRGAFDAPRLLTTLAWRLGGHRPPRLGQFGVRVLSACRTFKPTWLLATGVAPIEERVLREIGALGIARLIYLTDDPWNPAHHAPWFFDALPHYDRVFSPRHATLGHLTEAGCGEVAYLPFAYEPAVHFPQAPAGNAERERFVVDVVFAGGADADRVQLVAALIRSGFSMSLYGGYWERFRATRPYARGHADPGVLRKAVGGAKVALGLVRRANRDGHCMRTFEVPAMGGCMLAEDTEEHREILGADGDSVMYFRSADEMIAKLRGLLPDVMERARLAVSARHRIVSGQHTYGDRLRAMLGLTDPAAVV